MYITRTHIHPNTHTTHTHDPKKNGAAACPTNFPETLWSATAPRPSPPIKFARKLFRSRRRRILLFGYYLCRATHVRYF